MSTSPLSPEDIRAAAETHQELGPEYSDAVVASFIAKVDREVAARVEARLAGMAQDRPARPNRRAPLAKQRLQRGVLAASAFVLAVAVAIGVHGGSHPGLRPLSPPGQIVLLPVYHGRPGLVPPNGFPRAGLPHPPALPGGRH
jgi:anti-sigma-K factor RskA